MDFSQKYGKFIFRGLTLFVFFITVTKYEVNCTYENTKNSINPAASVSIFFKVIILFQIGYWLLVLLDYPFSFLPQKRYFQYGFYGLQFIGSSFLVIYVGTNKQDPQQQQQETDNCQEASARFVKEIVFTYMSTLFILLIWDCLQSRLAPSEGTPPNLAILYEPHGQGDRNRSPASPNEDPESARPLRELVATPQAASTQNPGAPVPPQLQEVPQVAPSSFLLDSYSVVVQEAAIFIVIGVIIKAKNYSCEGAKFITEYLFFVYAIVVPLVSVALIFHRKEPRSRKTKLLWTLSVLGGVFFLGAYLYSLDMLGRSEAFCPDDLTPYLLRFFIHLSIVNTTAVLLCYVFITCFLEGIQRLIQYSTSSRTSLHAQ